MKKKAIIFSGVDNFNNEFKFVVYCDESKVDDTIKYVNYYRTEIDDIEVVDCLSIDEL